MSNSRFLHTLTAGEKIGGAGVTSARQCRLAHALEHVLEIGEVPVRTRHEPGIGPRIPADRKAQAGHRARRLRSRLPQKFGETLYCAQRCRASRAVTNGSLLICTRRDAPWLSFMMMGDAPLIRASCGIR